MRQQVTGWSTADELLHERRVDTAIGIGVIAGMCLATFFSIYGILSFLDSFTDVLQ